MGKGLTHISTDYNTAQVPRPRITYRHLVEFPFTCSVIAVFKFSNRMPLIYFPIAFKKDLRIVSDIFSNILLW